MKLGVTLASMAVIHWGIMSSGDPHGFYGSMFVFYAMMVLDYNNPDTLYKRKYKKTISYIYGALCFFSFIGVGRLLNIRDINGQYFVAVDSIMRIGELAIINVNHLFYGMYGLILIVTGFEAVFPVKVGSNLREVNAK